MDNCMQLLEHVFVRGIGRRLLFEDDNDNRCFFALLARADKAAVRIHAWALMGNHAHLLLEGTPKDIASFMNGVLSSYARHYNARYDSVGHVFQGRYGRKIIDDDAQFLTVLRYIHQNPVKAGLTPTCEYSWSSYHEYLNAWNESLGQPHGFKPITTTSLANALLGSCESFALFHEQAGCDSSAPLSLLFETEEAEMANGRRDGGDSHALAVAENLYGEQWRDCICLVCKPLRDKRLRELKDAGLSIRQIARLTGLGRNIIAAA